MLRRSPSSPTYRLMGCEAEGAVVGSTAPTTPRPHVFRAKLPRAVTLREPQLSTPAAADPLARRGAVVAGPARRHVPSHMWMARMAWPLVAT